MRWTEDAKRTVTMRAPTHGALLRPDTRVIERPGWYQLVTPSAPGTMLNEVILSEIEDATDKVISDVTAIYAAIERPVKWCVGPWTRPADFGSRLAELGFSSWAVRGMVSETSRVPRPVSGVLVEECSDAELDTYVDVAMQGWSISPDQAVAERDTHRRAACSRPRQAHFFVARVGGEIAGTAAVIIIDGNHGYLAATQVLPVHRGRGVYRALVGARLAFLAQRGIALAVTQAREASSAPMLQHLGFETMFHSLCYLRDYRP
jgi:GNAT superfamily N-acetyltransferase